MEIEYLRPLCKKNKQTTTQTNKRSNMAPEGNIMFSICLFAIVFISYFLALFLPSFSASFSSLSLNSFNLDT